MGSRNDVSHALSQGELDLACLRLMRKPDFNTQYEIAHQALWPDAKEESFSELPRLDERIDWCMAHELAGTWWFFPSLYRWWYGIDLKDNQRYLLAVFKKLHDGEMQISLMRSGELAIFRTFQAHSVAPFWVYMQSTFMGTSFGALCQLFTLVRNALQPRAPKKPTTIERQDKMKTVMAIFNNELKQPTGAEQEYFARQIKTLNHVVMSKGYEALLKRNKKIVEVLFSGDNPQFCIWQSQYKQVQKHVEQLSGYDLSKVDIDGTSGTTAVEAIKRRAEDIQQCAVELAADYVQKAAEQNYREISETFKTAQKSHTINIREFEINSRNIIRKFNNKAIMLFDIDGIPDLTNLRKNQNQRLEQHRTRCATRLAVLETMTMQERAASIANDDPFSFETIILTCESTRQTLSHMPADSTLQTKMELIFCLVVQLIGAVQKQVKISDPDGSRGEQNLFVWLGHSEIQSDMDKLFQELDMAFGETYQQVEEALDPSAIKGSTYNHAGALVNLPSDMINLLNDLRKTVTLEGTDRDRIVARTLFDKYAVQLEALKEKASLYTQHIRVKQFFNELEKIEDVARAALIEHINDATHPVSVMKDILKNYQTSVKRALVTLPIELKEYPGIAATAKKREEAFSQVHKRVQAWLRTYYDDLKPFNQDKEAFEKLRKTLSQKYHPDTAIARQEWGDKNIHIAAAIYVKLKEWADQKYAQYIDAEALAQAVPKLRHLKTDNLKSLMAYVTSLKVHAKAQIELSFDKQYSQTHEDERIKPLRAELQRVKEQTESPNNDAIVLYNAPPVYPQENGLEILRRFTKELYILKYLAENEAESKLKINLSHADKEELLAFIEAAYNEITSLGWSCASTLKNKESCIQSDIGRYEEFIASWKNALAYYERREKEYTDTWEQFNRFESYLNLLELALKIVPKTCLYGKDAPQKTRFTCEVGISIRSAHLMARFKAVTDRIPGEAGSRPLGWDRVLVKMSQTPDSFYESISYGLWAMKHHKACSPEALKAAVAEYMKSNPQDPYNRPYPRRPDDRGPEIWAIVDMLGIAVEIERLATHTPMHGMRIYCDIYGVYGDLRSPMVILKETVNSYYYDAVVPLDQFVSQYVTFEKPDEYNEGSNVIDPPSSSSSIGDIFTDESYTDCNVSNRSSFSSPTSATKSISPAVTFAYTAVAEQTLLADTNANKNAVSLV